MSQLNGESVELHETHEISPPDPDVEPLKVNLYERMAQGGAQLIPLFPYDHAGSIVPCAAALIGGPGKAFGHFFHWNEADEVTVSYGSKGSMLATGMVIANQKLHGVNSFLENDQDPEAFGVLTITQHQGVDGSQNEAMIARCTECKEQIVRHDYNATPLGLEGYDAERYGAPDLPVRQFATILGSAEFVDIRNADDGRTCKSCGHVNDLFPNEPWGWDRVVSQTTAVGSAREAMVRVAEEQKNKEIA